MLRAMRKKMKRIVNLYAKCLVIWGEALLKSTPYGMA